MTLTQYCTETDIQNILSVFGETNRVDDEDTGEATTGVVSAAINRACTKINACLLSRYSVTVCAQSSWVTYCAAVLSAGLISTRRGNPMPQSLESECKEYIEQLDRIRQGFEPLMADDGPAVPAYDPTPTISNMTIDMRFPRSKVRRVPSTSTGGVQTAGRLQNNALDWFYYP